MYDDTKFKIIDMKPERDLINYIWTRLVALAGKVNLEGGLYLSRNIPYTIETLAVEFNRDSAQVILALEVLMELEMIEVTESKIFRVKNFVKHQNIKVKEKYEVQDKESMVNGEEVQLNEDLREEVFTSSNKEADDKSVKNQEESSKANKVISFENINNDIETINNSTYKSKDVGKKHDDSPILLDRKNKRSNRRKDEENFIKVTDDIEETSLIFFTDGVNEKPLGEGESVIGQWSF